MNNLIGQFLQQMEYLRIVENNQKNGPFLQVPPKYVLQ